LGSTSETARLILDCILQSEPWPRAALRELIEGDAPELFSVVAEGLSDRFEPRLSEAYSEVFAEVIASAIPGLEAGDLLKRYRRVRQPRRLVRDPRTVFVLSRVTLGADVAITSLILDGMKRRFPAARIVFAGPRKSYELFSSDPRIEHLQVPYYRTGALRDRICICPEFNEPDSIVIDPDSRITQLGLLPVCPEENYYLFDSRGYGAASGEPLGCLARRWLAETFACDEARPFIAPAERPEVESGMLALSLGVGEKDRKSVV
jgi:hypothetical protein